MLCDCSQAGGAGFSLLALACPLLDSHFRYPVLLHLIFPPVKEALGLLFHATTFSSLNSKVLLWQRHHQAHIRDVETIISEWHQDVHPLWAL